MDRMQFIGQTHQGVSISSVDDIINFFDHTIAAYEIVGDVEDANVHGITDNLHSSLRIQVQSPHQSELDSIVSYINNILHNRKSVYGRTFKVDALQDGQYIELYINEEK